MDDNNRVVDDGWCVGCGESYASCHCHWLEAEVDWWEDDDADTVEEDDTP